MNSNVSLLNNKFFKFSKKNNSEVFFLKKQKQIYSHNILELIKIGLKRNKDLKICLHKNINEKLHSMINFLYKKKFYKPHKHTSDEVYHFIKGKLKIVLFNSNNSISEILYLNKKTPIIRIDRDIYHMTIPSGRFSIFHEIKLGPFRKNKTSFIKKVFSSNISNK
jgi:cupin fold WbuC family metalloprotein